MKPFRIQWLKNCLVIVLIGFAGQITNAQIIYTDLEDSVLTYPPNIPGVTNSGTNYYYLDLDQDGTSDFIFDLYYYETWMSPSASELPSWVLSIYGNDTSNQVVIDGPAYYPFVLPIFDDEIIDNSLVYAGDACIHDINFISGANCVYFEGQSIGLKLVKDERNYFGWIRIVAYCEANGHASYIELIDCAMNTVPDELIKAGQKEIHFGWNEVSEADPIIVNDGYLVSVHLPGTSPFDLSIFNLQGKLMQRTRSCDNSFQFNISDFPTGLYLLNIVSGNKAKCLKIIKL